MAIRARRACLVVPGSSARMLAKARELAADEVVVDLEDGVAEADKELARAQAVAAGPGALRNESLPLGMEYLSREYSKYFNECHGRVGRFLRKRYGSRRIGDRGDVLGAYAYVVLNPVAEGMCDRAEDWRWSRYATTIGISGDFGFVDARVVVSELNGSLDALRELVAARATVVRKGRVG